jgi:hypothetical protein
MIQSLLRAVLLLLKTKNQTSLKNSMTNSSGNNLSLDMARTKLRKVVVLEAVSDQVITPLVNNDVLIRFCDFIYMFLIIFETI